MSYKKCLLTLTLEYSDMVFFKNQCLYIINLTYQKCMQQLQIGPFKCTVGESYHMMHISHRSHCYVMHYPERQPALVSWWAISAVCLVRYALQLSIDEQSVWCNPLKQHPDQWPRDACCSGKHLTKLQRAVCGTGLQIKIAAFEIHHIVRTLNWINIHQNIMENPALLCNCW